jgi:hypothetical protein
MSGNLLAEKLDIKPHSTLWLSPPGKAPLLHPLPEDVHGVNGPHEASTALLFAHDEHALREALDQHREHLAQPAAFWVAYPSPVDVDALEPLLREYGLRPGDQIAIDDTWSALRLRALA